jgi:large subunit ribosomal protein L29
MKGNEIREMAEQDITAKIEELEKERFNLTFASGSRPLENPLRLRFIRRDIARLKTVQNEKRMGAK